MFSQATRSITTAPEREREVGEFPLQEARSSQNRVSWDWNAGLRGRFYPVQLLPHTTLPWLLPGHFLSLILSSRHIY